MKNILKNMSKKQLALSVSIGLVAIIILIVLMISVAKQNAQKEQQIREQQAELQLTKKIESAIEVIKQTSPITNDETIPTQTGITYEKSGVQIQTQEAGNAVIVKSVVLEKPGFIAVYDDSGEGTLGKLLNKSTYFSRGVYPIVSIAVPESLKKGSKYYLTIQFDSDDNGFFDPTVDLPIVDSNGDTLFATFTAK